MKTSVRTLSLFGESLDAEFAWRAKELVDIRLSVKAAAGSERKMLIRAGIALLYAHWEGFIKSSSTLYIEFVNKRGHAYQDLKTTFIALGLSKRLGEVTDTKKHSLRISAVNFILDNCAKRAELPAQSAINTRSNLNSEVFTDIAVICGIDSSKYEPFYNLIDKSLLKRRNAIAHGDHLDVDTDQFLTLCEEVQQLMRWYKTDIDNAAATEAYKRLP